MTHHRNSLWRILWRISVPLCFALLAFCPARGVLAEVLAPNNDEEIVFFDNNNVIRILDPRPSSPVLEVEWASPDGGWGNMALGDVTGDGDMEIIAIRPDGNQGRLTIFDPVAQDSAEDQVQMQNDIPWAILFELTLPRPPRLIATGNFDTSRAGREILYSYALDDESDRFVILRSTGEGGPGRGWEEQRVFDLEGRWTAVATGNVFVNDVIDEVGLVSFSRGELALYRVEPEVVRSFQNINEQHRWSNVAFGQYIAVNNDGDEIGAVRDGEFPLATAWVFRYDGTNFVDQLGERFYPSPNVVFFADINGNNDDEAVFLRQVQQELGPRQRLIIRDGNSNDTITMREDLLDGDNEYKGGDAGDLDGDNRDEIVLVRNNRIRIYMEPQSVTTFQLIEQLTNGSTVKVGNVDAAGLAARPRLVATRPSLSDILQPGQVGSTRVITVLDATQGSSLPFTLDVQGADEWINIEQSSSLLPAGLSITFNSEGVQPGDYSGRIVVDVQTSGVENDPLAIDLALRVESVVESSPPSVDFVYYPCEGTLQPSDKSVALSASSALSYTAQIEGNPNWVTVAPEAGVLPEEVTVSVDPMLRPADIVTVDLLVTVDLPNEPAVINRVPINLACPENRIFLPSIDD